MFCNLNSPSACKAFFIILSFAVFSVFGVAYFYRCDRTAKHPSLIIKKNENAIDSVVIGSGVGGLTSAIYLSQMGASVLLIDGSAPGGALAKTKWIENWPGEKKIEAAVLVENIRAQALASGVKIVSGSVAAVDFSEVPYRLFLNDEKTILANSVIIATGATPRTLGVPGEREYWGKGVTTCAICDGPFFKEKPVMVVGGGDSAMVEAEFLSRLASKVTVLVRGSKLRAKSSLVQRVSRLKNVQIIYNSSIVSINGSLESGVHSVDVDINGTTNSVEANCIFLAIGATPNSGIFEQWLTLENGGIIKTDRYQKTSRPGIFAIGDVADNYSRQAITAAGAGCTAAIGALEFLGEHHLIEQKKESLKQNSDQNSVQDFDLKVGTDSDETSFVPASGDKKNGYENKKAQTSEIQEVSSSKALDLILRSGRPTIVDFYASWCYPCKLMLPIFKSLCSELGSSVNFVKVNIEDASEIASNHKVMAVPTFIIFDKTGLKVDSVVGGVTEEKLREKLKKYL